MESIPLDFTETPAVENKKYGEKMQFEASGPYQKTRTKTDFCWLVGFILYLVVWLIIIIYAFSRGNTIKGLKPRDSAGRICGYDSGVEDKPYLVRYDAYGCNDLTGCLACQSECPQKDFNFEELNRRHKRDTEHANSNQDVKEMRGDVIKQSIAEIESPDAKNEPTETRTDNSDSSSNGKTAKEHSPSKAENDNANGNANSGVENTSPKPSTENDGREKSSTIRTTSTTTTTTTASPNNGHHSHESTSKFDEAIKNVICQSDVNLDLIKKMDKLRYLVERGKCSGSYNKTWEIYDYRCGFNVSSDSPIISERQFAKSSIARDLNNAKYSIMGFIMLSGLIAVASIFLMRWYALAYVCISIFVICAAAFHYIYEKCVLNAESKTNGVLLALFLGVVAFVIVVLVAIYFRKELCLACQMIEESCKAITCVLSSLAVPFIFFVIYTLIFMPGVSSYYLLSSLETPIYKVDLADGEKCECPSNLGYWQNATCDPATFRSQCQQETGAACILSGCYMDGKRSQSVGFLHFVNWVGLAWSFFFVLGFNDIVLASVFSTWYWTFNKKILSYLTVIESFWRITMNHLGTVALGSLIITICTTVEMIVNSIKRSLKKSNRPCSAVILLSFHCLFDVVENLIEFINRRAYIMCAMHGTDFFQSARTAYYLFMRNKERVIGVVTATNCLTIFTNVVIACLTTQIARSYYDAYRADDLSDTGSPLLLIFLGSYAICCMFMRAVEMSVGTVFVCFLEDTERNDGSSEKPYFMSEGLTKFLYRK